MVVVVVTVVVAVLMTRCGITGQASSNMCVVGPQGPHITATTRRGNASSAFRERPALRRQEASKLHRGPSMPVDRPRDRAWIDPCQTGTGGPWLSMAHRECNRPRY